MADDRVTKKGASMGSLIALMLPGFVIAAAIFDLRTFKIPNPLVAMMLAVWPVAVLAIGVPFHVAAVTALAALILLGAGIFLFANNWLGAGDVKLISASVLYVGVPALGQFVLATTLAGAALAIFLVFFRRMPLPTPFVGQGWLTELHARTRVMPYGVAIAVGALVIWAQGSALIA